MNDTTDLLGTLKGCTVVHCDDSHMIVWNGSLTFRVIAVVYKRQGVALVEYDVWTTMDPPASVNKAIDSAAERVRSPEFLTYQRYLEDSR